MADDNSSEFQELNSNLRELISLLRNPSASRIKTPSSNVSDNKAQKIFTKAGDLISGIADLEKQITRNKGSLEGLDKIKNQINRYKKALGDIDSSIKSLKSSGDSSNYVFKAENRLLKGKATLAHYGHKIGGYASQISQDQLANIQRQEQQKVLRGEARASQAEEKRNKYQRAYEAQEGMWISRGSYIKNKFPFIGSNATNLKSLQVEHQELTELFRSEKDLGIRQTYIQRGRENELNQERALYNLGRGSLFNIGGKPVGTDPGEIFGALKGASLARLASGGPIGQVVAGIIQVGTAIAKTANIVTKVPQMIAGFTGSLVSGASPASSVYKQSQLLSLITGSQSTSDFRRWWHPERSSVYSSMLHTRHPMAIGPGEMTKLLGGMALSGVPGGSGMSERGMFAKQLNDAVFYSSRFGGSMNLSSLIKTMATGTPGYNFGTAQAQLPSSFAGVLNIARGRHQDINSVYRSMDRAVATAQGNQNTTFGSFGGGFGGLASAISGYGASAQYNPASTMTSLVGGAQSLHRGAFGNPAYTVGQMMFLQSHGGLRGLMNKGIYKDILQDYGKTHPDLLKFGLASPGGAAIFMRAALSGHARNYNYAVSSLGMTGLPPAIQSLMLGNATGLGVSAADFIRRTISKNPQTTVSATTLATAHGHGIAPGSDLATAMTAPIGQEMIQFTASMTALVKSGVITKFGSEIGSLNMAVHNLTQGMGRLFHIIDHLKAS